jgi:hypothetical protein
MRNKLNYSLQSKLGNNNEKNFNCLILSFTSTHNLGQQSICGLYNQDIHFGLLQRLRALQNVGREFSRVLKFVRRFFHNKLSQSLDKENYEALLTTFKL